jgi:hypothetical protein
MQMTAFSAPLGRWIDAARTAWDWWLSELWNTVPMSLKTRLRARARVDIYLHDDRVELLCTDGKVQFQLCEERPLAALDEASWDELTQTLIDRSARVFLRERDVFCFELSVPRATGRDLPSAIAIQLELASPIDPELTSWSWATVSVTRESALVLVALARSSALDAIQRQFEQRGLLCPPIHAQTPAGIMRLRRGRTCFESMSRRWQRRAVLWSTLLLLSLPLLTLAGAHLLAAIDQAELNGLRQAAAPKLAALRDARRNARLWQAYIPLRALPSSTMMLSELGERAPEGTSIENIDYRGGRTMAFDWAGDTGPAALDDFIRAPGKLSIARPADAEKLMSPVPLSGELH